jgi:hypothetical protein
MRRAAWLTFLLPTLLPAQAPAKADAKPAKPAEWPALDAAAAARAEQLAKNLAHEKEEVRKNAAAELQQLGAGAAPALLRKLTDRAPEKNEPYLAALDAVVTAEQAGPLSRVLRDTRASARVWALRRFTAFHDPAHAPILRSALADRDPEVKFRAALALAAGGDLTGMDLVLERARSDWKELGGELLAALEPARGEKPARWLLDKLEPTEFSAALARIRLLRALGTKETVVILKPLLDSNDHALKRETINTLRVVIDGQPVLDDLSVFQAIEMAKEWKQKI